MSIARTDVTKEKLFDEFNAVIAETEQLLKSVANASGDKAGAFRASVQEGLAAAGERISQIREDTLAQAGATARATDDYVQENPWRAVGMVAALAAVTGLLAGVLISRR